VFTICQKNVLEVLTTLKKIEDKWFTAKEIRKYLLSNRMDCNERSLYIKLLRLAEFDLIKCKGVGVWKHFKVFKVR
jgi:hypothetical protein